MSLNYRAVKKKQFISVLLLLSFINCSKEQIEVPLYFKINGIAHYPIVEKAYADYDCGLRTYEITAYEGDRFYKINFTDVGTVEPGLYVSENPPTNSTPNSATFWYSNEGYTYTAMPFIIAVHSYNNCFLKASFSGGIVSDGRLNLRIKES